MAITDSKIEYYENDISIKYDKSILLQNNPSQIVSDLTLKEFYDKCEERNFEIILSEFQKNKLDLKLNDWFYFKLIEKTISQIFFKYDSNNKSLFVWYILTKSGYDAFVRTGESFDIFILADSSVSSKESILFDENTYSRITKGSQLHGKKGKYFHYSPRRNSEKFTIKLEFPILKKDSIIYRDINIKIEGKEEVFNITLSYNRILFMKDSSIPAQLSEYFNCKFSNVIYNSLIQQLREKILNKNTDESVKYLLSFSRKVATHIDDEKEFGYSKPMIPEELLYYGKGDCEDRAALFYSLVKELIKVPMILVLYPDHMNIGVKLNEVYGTPIEYLNVLFTICEPSETTDLTGLGVNLNKSIYLNPKVIYYYSEN